MWIVNLRQDLNASINLRDAVGLTVNACGWVTADGLVGTLHNKNAFSCRAAKRPYTVKCHVMTFYVGFLKQKALKLPIANKAKTVVGSGTCTTATDTGGIKLSTSKIPVPDLPSLNNTEKVISARPKSLPGSKKSKRKPGPMPSVS